MTPADKQFEEFKNATKKPIPNGSYFKAFGWEVSTRGTIAMICTVTLCYLAIKAPAENSQTFREMIVAVIFFYFGQARVNKTP